MAECPMPEHGSGTVAALLRGMWGGDEDHVTWNAARRLGRRAFVEARVFGAGLALGLVLAVWNTIAGGTFADRDLRRLTLEAVYYLAGSMVLAGVSARLEWQYLARRFRGDDRDVSARAPTLL